MDFNAYDYIHHNPASYGHMNIVRFLALYESYKKTLGIAGHIAEVGIWKASCLLLFAKLALIFEPESLTLVHGFDWYRGMEPGPDEDSESVQMLWRESEGSKDEIQQRSDHEATEMYERIKKLIDLQDLSHIAHLHKLDVVTELDQFFDENPHIQFKLVLLDAGTYYVVKACLSQFWPRPISGGMLILDQFNHEIAPGETRAVREYLPDTPVYSNGFTNHPSAYMVKPSRNAH
jgi:hypothetical protein